jgi:hypothetical protein
MPVNAYMLFCNAKRGEVKSKNPGVGVPQLGKLIGAEWRKLSEGEKEKWKAKAAAERGSEGGSKGKSTKGKESKGKESKGGEKKGKK